jgi:hypothetical protein
VCAFSQHHWREEPKDPKDRYGFSVDPGRHSEPWRTKVVRIFHGVFP